MMGLDILGAMTSFLATYYFIRLNSHGWLISLAATSVNGWLYWQKGIYSDMLLELFYFITACYGWLKWKKTLDIQRCDKSITTLTKNQLLALSLIILMLSFSLFFMLTFFTDSNVAILDALTTSLSLAGQWLMCHKIITTWIIWFITDALYAYLYLKKQIPVHVLLMLLYTGLAIYGYLSWFKEVKTQKLKIKLR